METHASFNILDYIVLGTILLSGLLAIMTGFVREMYSLLNWIVSYFIAMRFYPVALPHIQKYLSNPRTAADASIFAVFCLSFIVLAIAGIFITNFIQGKALTAIDRSLGFVFGIARGLLIVCLMYLVVISVIWPDLDKPPVETASITDTTQAPTPTPPPDKPADAKTQDGKPQLVMLAPQWLIEARTRPLLSRGAHMLKDVIPAKMLERTTDIVLKQKEEAKQKAIKDMEKAGYNSAVQQGAQVMTGPATTVQSP
jgi:membrane protein required for colicin V production